MTPELPEPITAVDRLFDPPWTAGDVLRMIQPGTYREYGHRAEQNPYRHSAFVALGAFARVGSAAAGRLRLSHWRPNGQEIVIVQNPEPHPVPVLPLLRSTVEAYLAVRPNSNDGEDWLFVNRFGNRCTAASFRFPMWSISAHLGIRSDELSDGIKTFYDRCFEHEPDRQTVIALRGMASGVLDQDTVRAPVDLARMRRVLERNHPLSGPAEKYEGIRGARLLSKLKQNLPPPPNGARLEPGPAMSDDPVVRSLLAIEWPNDPGAQAALSATLRERHFEYLDDLRGAKRLRLREVAHLLRITVQRANTWRLRRKGRPDLPQRPAHIGRRYKWVTPEWRKRTIEGFRKRPPGETLNAFSERLRREADCPYNPVTIRRILQKSGDVRRRRGRPRKRRASL